MYVCLEDKVPIKPVPIRYLVAPIAQLAKGLALRCRKSEVRIPDWAGYGYVHSKSLEG